MSVAVKNTAEATTPKPFDRLAVDSLVGVFYLLGSLGILFYVLPHLWWNVLRLQATPINSILLFLAVVAAGIGLCLVGSRLAGPNPPKGLHAGVFTGFVGLVSIAYVTSWMGLLFESLIGSGNVMLGAALTIAVGAALLIAFFRLFFKPGFENGLIAFEEQGWFTSAPYKKSQGLRVRRGTILGVLLLAGSGIYTMQSHRTLDTYTDWGVPLPYFYTVRITSVPAERLESVADYLQTTKGWDKETAQAAMKELPMVVERYISAERLTEVSAELTAAGARFSDKHQLFSLLPYVKFTVPLLLAAFSLWFAYRVVNYPTFADFLIATEAEVNKVSWTTRRRLVQDTIVVLVTVVIMTTFLFLVDNLWAWSLTKIHVLQMPPQSAKQPGQKEQPW